MLIAALIIGMLLFSRGGVLALRMVAAAGGAAVLLGALYLFVHRAHVVVTPTEIGKAGFIGLARMHPRSDVAALVMATTPDIRPCGNLFVFDHAGQRIMRLRSMLWAVEDMQRVADRLGITPVDLGFISGPQLAKQYPNAVRGFERNPVRFAVLSVVFLIVVIPVTIGVITATINAIR